MMNGKRVVFFIGVLFLFSSGLFAQRVDVRELKRNLKQDIHFVNYMGPQPVIESAEDIVNTGKILALRLKRNGRIGEIGLKYSVYHVIGSPKEKGLNADIISIDKNARVDHIKNVRRIISGYLKEAYGYSDIDSFSLAVFVTLYNAVYRGNMEYFQSVYKREVMKYLDGSNAGISLKYYEWPGKTRLVIPLTEEAKEGGLSSVSTGEVSKEPVIEAARKSETKELEARKGMVSIKEREIEKKREEIGELEKEISREEREKEQLEKTIEEKAKKLKEGKANGTLSEEEVRRKEKELEVLKKEREEKERKIKELSEKQRKAKQEVEEKEKSIEKEREQIAKDESALSDTKKVESAMEKGTATEVSEPLYFLFMGQNEFSRLIVMDFDTLGLQKQSKVKSIVDREILFFKGEIVVKAFDDSSEAERKEGMVSLYLLNPDDLSTKAKSDAIVWKNSKVLGFKDSLFAIGRVGGMFRIIAFDGELKIRVYSDIEVNKDSYFNIYNNLVVIQDSSDRIRLLGVEDLKIAE